jgi:hypothetical protein
MDPLAAVEQTLGPLSGWPEYVTKPMFLVEPEDALVRDIAAYFYGNKIEVETAWKCYATCNSAAPASIEAAVKKYYAEWTTDSKVTNVPYYNMTTKKFTLVNGDCNWEIPDITEMLTNVRRVRQILATPPETPEDALERHSRATVMRLCLRKYT